MPASICPQKLNLTSPPLSLRARSPAVTRPGSPDVPQAPSPPRARGEQRQETAIFGPKPVPALRPRPCARTLRGSLVLCRDPSRLSASRGVARLGSTAQLRGEKAVKATVSNAIEQFNLLGWGMPAAEMLHRLQTPAFAGRSGGGGSRAGSPQYFLNIYSEEDLPVFLFISISIYLSIFLFISIFVAVNPKHPPASALQTTRSRCRGRARLSFCQFGKKEGVQPSAPRFWGPRGPPGRTRTCPRSRWRGGPASMRPPVRQLCLPLGGGCPALLSSPRANANSSKLDLSLPIGSAIYLYFFIIYFIFFWRAN